MPINEKIFMEIIKNAPLSAIDVILFNENEKVLLGKRLNRPAQGYWFVPGGRILKDETRGNAFQRICERELGLNLYFKKARLKGAYDHIYKDNYFGIEGIGTHYLVLGYEYRLGSECAKIRLDSQHEAIRWMSVEELLKDPDVHTNTKLYFK